MTDPRFKYGDPQMILIHATPQPKYPTEIEACLHGYNPQDVRFTPAPISDHLYCYACRQRKHKDLFYANRARPNGKQTRCKACYKAGKKTAPRVIYTDRWYRG